MIEDDDPLLVRVQIQLGRALLDQIDSARGDVSRAGFIRRLLQDWAETEAIEAEAEVFTGGAVSKLDLSVGHTRPRPGSRLKK